MKKFLSSEDVSQDFLENARFSKPQRIVGKDLILRNAMQSDAEFILKLRTDSFKGKFLSKTRNNIAGQREWLKRYEQDASQVYLIITDKNGETYGTVRLYDAKSESFCWGSWILKQGSPVSFSIESALMVYHFALSLGFTESHFDVRKGNESVWRFHERFGAVRIAETDDDYLYTITQSAIKASLEKYKKYLPCGIDIIF
jgi:RimJ/RimL family protein N-acetyltransferase